MKMMRTKKAAFTGIEEEIELIGVNTCGDCPAKKAGGGYQGGDRQKIRGEE